MAKSIDSQYSFTGGEVSPKIDARVDNPKYKSSLRQCLNMIPLSQGPITRRNGTQFIAKAKLSNVVPGSNFAARLMKFVFSPDTTFMLEFGEHYIRFYSNGAQVVVPSAPLWVSGTAYIAGNYATSTINALIYYCVLAVTGTTDPSADGGAHWVQQTILEVPTPYNADAGFNPVWTADVYQVVPCQINDVVYLVHPSYPPYKLTRLTDTSWTMVQVSYDLPSGLDQNTSNTVLTPSATSGSITVTASAPAWVTSTFYITGNSVEVAGVLYLCTTTHTSSGTFAAELAAGLWVTQTIFQSGHVGSTWIFSTLRAASTLAQAITGNVTTTVIPVKGVWNVETTETWSADISIQRSYDGGFTWATILQISSRGDVNVDEGGTETLDTLFRIVIANWTTIASTIPPRVILTNAAAFVNGTFQITAVSSNTVATATVIEGLNSTVASQYWSEAAWSGVRGYPRAVCSFQQRIIYAGSTFQPQRIWGTVTNDLENFDLGDQSQATDSFAFDLAAMGRGPILWLIAQIDLFVGLSGAEWVVNSGATSQGASLGGAITPSAINAVEHSNWGSSVGVQPYIVGDAVVYCQRQATAIRQMLFSVYTQKYMSQEITEMADHLFTSGIEQMDYQPQYRGQGILWCVTQQGILCGLSYDLEREVFGWHKHQTGYGQTNPQTGAALTNDSGYESVCVIDGKGIVDDEVWVTVRRTTGTLFTVSRYIERINPANWETTFVAAPTPPAPVLSSAFYVDCGVTVNNPGSATIMAVPHLPVRWVVGLMDGQPFGPVLSDTSGNITIPNFPPIAPLPSVVQVGLPIRYACQPMRIDADPRAGNTQGLYKQDSDLFIRVMNSTGGLISNGTTGTNAQVPVPIAYDSVVTPLAGPALVTNPTDIRIEPQFMPTPGTDPVILVTGNDAQPLTVLALVRKYSIDSTP